MRSVYDYSGQSYRKYAKEKRAGGMESKMAALSLSSYDKNFDRENAVTFLPYFIALEEKQNGNASITDEMIAERLSKAKRNIKPTPKRVEYYPYEDAGLNFKMYRSYDPDYNDYDSRTYKAVIDHRITDQEKRELEEALWVYFHDPYCDGRDCTGAPFTSWIRFMRCTDRTIVIHRISFDV